MSLDTSRWYTPVAPGAGKARSVGWWAMLLAGTALLLFQGTLVAAYIYIRWGHGPWPPEGFEAPHPAGLTPVLIPLAAAGIMSWGLRRFRRGGRGAPRLALLATLALGAVAAALRMLTYADVDFRWDEQAYASLFWVMGVYEISILVLGLIVSVVVLVQAMVGLLSAGRSGILEVTVLFWWFVAITSVVSMGTLYLGPYL